MVVPSGAAFFRVSTAMVPDAPALLSISTLRPVRCLSGSARKRAMTSVPPPAGKPTRILSGLSGKPLCCARTAASGAVTAAPARVSAERRVMLLVICVPSNDYSTDQAPRQLGTLARRATHLDRFGIGRIALQAAAIDALGDGGQPEQREGEVVVPVRYGFAAGAPAVGRDIVLFG